MAGETSGPAILGDIVVVDVEEKGEQEAMEDVESRCNRRVINFLQSVIAHLGDAGGCRHAIAYLTTVALGPAPFVLIARAIVHAPMLRG